jgi:hypothetical protein
MCVGWVHIRPARHLAAIVLLWSTVLVLSGTSQPGLVLLGYMLLSVPRLLHELGHAQLGHWLGREVKVVVWNPLAASVRFAGAASERARRLSALAGPLLQASAGVALLIVVVAAGATWPAAIRELVVVVAFFHVANLANLVPAAGLDGAHVFGWAWRSHPRWVVRMPALVFPLVGVPAVALWLFPAGFVHATVVTALQSAGQ